MKIEKQEKNPFEMLQFYFQLGLLNIGLLIIIIKQINTIYSIFSFVFIFIFCSLINHHLFHHGETKTDENYMLIINPKINQQLIKIRTKIVTKLHETEKLHEKKKLNYILSMLALIYFAIIFLPDWLEIFLFMNFIYTYFLFPKLFENGRNFLWSIINYSIKTY